VAGRDERSLVAGVVTPAIVDGIRAPVAPRVVRIDGALHEDAWWLEASFSLGFWDSLILAGARATRCRYLLNEELQPGQDLDGVAVVDPFATRPQDLPLS
jgi:predicted nucleic acid-binding protein